MKQQRPTLTEILNQVATLTKQPEDQIRSKSRKEQLVICRHLVAYIANRKYNYSKGAIGRFFDHCNHCSALNGVRVINDLMQTDGKIRNLVNTLQQ